MNTWIAAHASAFSSTNAITLSPVNNTNTSLNLPMTSAMGPFFPGQSLFVSSVQMHIEITNPRIEFLAGTTSVHVIQNTGRYTGTSLQTFDVPHVNMSQVTTVSISSTSTIDPNIIWYGLQRTNNADQSSGFIFTGNFTFDTVPLMIFDNTTELTAIYELTTGILATPPITSRQTTINQININPVGYNFNPFYLTIPTFRFTGSGASTATPVPFSLRLSDTNFFNFTLNTGTLYPNGIVIPFTNPSVVPSSENGTVVTLTNTITPPQFIRGSASITGSLICLLTGVLNLSVVTLYNENSGLAVRLFGTGVTIDPVFNPNNIDNRSPVTFAPGKSVFFSSILTATDTISANTMSYTIFPPTPNVVSFTQLPGSNQSVTMGQQFNQNNATITLFAHSRGAPGLNARSIFSQLSIFNYQNLLPGRVVPFVNTYNSAPMTYTDNSNPSSFAYMNVTFTQNVVLNSLDFGYVFPIFLPASTVTTGGYAVNATSSVTAATFTITVTSVPRTVGEPVIVYGRVQFVCRQNHGNAHVALHNAANNQIGANDGTLISIPFTTTALTPLPMFVNSFTPSVAGSNFTFNVGDQVRIEFGFGQAGSQYFGTPTDPTQFLGILQAPQPEMLGALVCTPNTVGNLTFNPLPAIIGNSSGNSPITADIIHTVETQLISFNAPTIICGFRLTSFRLTGVTAVMRIRVNLFRNGNPTSILQVYFNYSDSRLSATPAPLFIPFSYAEFARYAAIPANANDVVRIDPMTIVFSRPQHPIFNAGDTLRIEISVTTATTPGVQSQTSPQSIAYTGNANDNPNTIAGRLTGIILNTPTITLQPNLPVTPIFSFHTNIRRIPIPTPTSNSTGAFDYTATGASVEGNEVVTGRFLTLQSRIAIQAFQRSSTIFTSSSSTTFPAIDCINTATATMTLYTNGPGEITEFTSNPTVFNACIREEITTLEGFSFQFFGGYRPDQISSDASFRMSVSVMRGTTLISSLSIAFDVLPMNIPPAPVNLIDGTMTYIPFTNTLTTPTFVRNLTYTNDTFAGSQPLGAVLRGDIVSVTFSRTSSGGNASMQITRMNSFMSPTTGATYLMGSLVTSGGAVNNTFIDEPFVTGENSGRTVVRDSNTILIPPRAFPTSVIPGSSTLILNSLWLPAINTIPFQGMAALSIDNPNFITISIIVDGVGHICRTVITVALTNETTSALDLPLNVRVPGAQFSRESSPFEGRGYFIQSIVTSVNPDHENFRIGPFNTVTPIIAFPRITNIWNQVSFTVDLQSSGRPIIIQNSIGRICQLGVVYVN